MSVETIAGVFQGLDQGVRNFINIKNAMSKQKDDKAQSDIEFKIRKLKLQQAERDMSPEILARETEKYKLDKQATEIESKLRVVKIREAEVGIRKNIEETKNELLSRARFLRIMQENKPMAPGSAMSFGGLKVAGPRQVLKEGDRLIDDSIIYPEGQDKQKEDFWSAFK